LRLACCNAAVDQRQLDMVGLVQTQPVEIACRKMLAATARGPKLLYRALQIDCHDRAL
jgi:hypothetical protein